MPANPLHLGLAFALCRVWGRLDCGALVASSLLVDVEPGAVMLLGLDARLHGPLHTVGAALALGWLAGLAGWLVWGRLGLPRRSDGAVWAALSGVLGWAGHVALDSPLYADITPLWPLSGGNPAYMALGAATVPAVYAASAAATLWGLAWLALGLGGEGAEGDGEGA